MAIDRRTLLLAALALPFGAARAEAGAAELIGSWRDADGAAHVGWLDPALHIHRALPLPTRAHGLLALPCGGLVAVARRPGTWLLRWDGAPQWLWQPAERRFSGHVVYAGGALYTTETDTDIDAAVDGSADSAGSGTARHSGLLVRRDARTLAVQAEWPTQGVDPHEVLALPDGRFLVANGGVLTRPETGRAKWSHEQVESSHVCFTADGKPSGTWRLADRRLSLRHLARHASGVVGIAMQSQAADPAGAPLLALWDGRSLRVAEQPVPLAGYGGSIAATAAGFAVSAPRAQAVAEWRADGRWLGQQPHPEACALAWDGAQLRVGGEADALKIDNHWVLAA